MSEIVEVRLWGTTVGHLGYKPGQTRISTFEYSPELVNSTIELSPVTMPNRVANHTFPGNSQRTFKGLPGIFADSLPDKFGNQLIDIYMAEQGVPAIDITALDRLLYVGDRAMGALEYHPSKTFAGDRKKPTSLDIQQLSELANLVQGNQADLANELADAASREMALKFIRVSSSAGGARSKALIAVAENSDIKDGTLDHGINHTYWLLKFDSSQNRDRDASDPRGMTRVEYIYSLIAQNCGINMPKTRYLITDDEFHFMIERFDRVRLENRLDKLHYASWSGLAHAHRDETGAYSYEQLIVLARQLKVGQAAITELFRRAIFNVVGRNQDDHTKNFGFLMNRQGEWSLAPAFDMTYAFDPSGRWTRNHQTRLAGKETDFSRDDLLRFARHCNLNERQANNEIAKVQQAFTDFKTLASEFEVPGDLAQTIASNHRYF